MVAYGAYMTWIKDSAPELLSPPVPAEIMLLRARRGPRRLLVPKLPRREHAEHDRRRCQQ